jgi:hypothetical protein
MSDATVARNGFEPPTIENCKCREEDPDGDSASGQT